VKRVTNLLHLLIGIAALAVGAYCFRGLVQGGKTWFQQRSVGARPARSAKSGSSADNLKMYGVLSQPDEAAGGDDSVPAQGDGSASVRDPAYTGDPGAPDHFLHRRLSVKTYQFFEFEIPAHAVRPELEGTFQSVATRQNPEGGPSVEVLLMNHEEFGRFVNHRPVSTKFSSHPSSGGEIYWQLNTPAGSPQKYYLVFRNSSEGLGPSIVDADFTASFE